ncbi:hypothetical protein Trydic_g15516 [Trypoxylus dichotomus]
MGNRCDHPYEQTPGVPEPDTVDGPQLPLVRKKHHATRRRWSGATHRLHPKNSQPILRPSGEPLEPPRVDVTPGSSGGILGHGRSSWTTKTDSRAPRNETLTLR